MKISKSKRTVFLCGPIRGMPRSESLSWREKAVNLLKKDFKVLHALRGREEKETFPDRKLAIARDLDDVKRSDIVIVNDTVKESSMIGSSMEFFYAKRLGKIVIAFGRVHEGDYFFDHHIDGRVETLEKACELINRMFSD